MKSFLTRFSGRYKRTRGWWNKWQSWVGRVNHQIGRVKAAYGLLKAPVNLSSKVFGPHLGPMIAGIVGLSAVAGSATVTTMVVTGGPTFEAGDHGLYLAPGNVPIQQREGDNTLEVVFGSTTVDSISITDATAGRASGITEALKIGGEYVDPNTFTLSTNTLTIDGLFCTKLTISNSTIHTLILQDNQADGNDFSISFGAVSPPAVVPGPSAPRGLETEGSGYDKILLQAGTVSGKVGNISLTGIKTFGAPCIVEYMAIGTMMVKNSLLGSGDGLSSKDFVLDSTVTVHSFTDTNNLEVTLSVVE